MVLVQCEVILFAAPMFALLRDVSTDGRYVGFVLLIWTFPMSTLGLIIGPKIGAFRRARRGNVPDRRKKRGSSSGKVHVSGVIVPRTPHNSVATPRESLENPVLLVEEALRHLSTEEEPRSLDNIAKSSPEPQELTLIEE